MYPPCKTENPESQREDRTELGRNSPEDSDGKGSGNARVNSPAEAWEKLLATHWNCGTDTKRDRTRKIPKDVKETHNTSYSLGTRV